MARVKHTVEEIRDMMDPDVIKLFKRFRCFDKLLKNCTRTVNQAIDTATSIFDEDTSKWDKPDKILKNVTSKDWRNVILLGFLWPESPEGSEYWDKKHSKISLELTKNDVRMGRN